MEHYKQGYNECFPTVLGMLTGKHPKLVIRDLSGKKNYNWGVEFQQSDQWIYLLKRFDQWRDKRNMRWLSNAAMVSLKASALSAMGETLKEIKDYPAPPYGMRGAFVVEYSYSSGSHIVAFEDSKVYDPSLDKPYPWNDWVQISYSLHPRSMAIWLKHVFIEPSPQLELALWR